MISILIVEDDGDLNRSLCRFLSGEGYSPQGVRTGQEGINALYAKHFDMIISDIMMPGMDGFAFARTIREQDRYIPILFMTARDDFLSKEKGYDLGVDDYLVKPVDFRELQLHIRALLRRARIMESRRITIGNLVLDEDSCGGGRKTCFAHAPGIPDPVQAPVLSESNLHKEPAPG